MLLWMEVRSPRGLFLSRLAYTDGERMGWYEMEIRKEGHGGAAGRQAHYLPAARCGGRDRDGAGGGGHLLCRAVPCLHGGVCNGGSSITKHIAGQESAPLYSFKIFPHAKNGLFSLFFSPLRIAQNFRGFSVTQNTCFCRIFQKCYRRVCICPLYCANALAIRIVKNQTILAISIYAVYTRFIGVKIQKVI